MSNSKVYYYIFGVIALAIIGYLFIKPNLGGAELVTVMYRGDPVNVASSRWDKLPDKTSSLVKAAWYDEDNQYMIIDLNGTKYHYCGLPRSVWSNLKIAESYGTYYSSSIRGSFDCRTFPVPSY